MKIRALNPHGGYALDTATGLGYTAICTHAISIENCSAY